MRDRLAGTSRHLKWEYYCGSKTASGNDCFASKINLYPRQPTASLPFPTRMQGHPEVRASADFHADKFIQFRKPAQQRTGLAGSPNRHFIKSLDVYGGRASIISPTAAGRWFQT
jgi:hypothetical protein